MPASRLSAFLLLALANLFWSGNWIAGRALRDMFDPVSMNFWRWTVAALVLAPGRRGGGAWTPAGVGGVGFFWGMPQAPPAGRGGLPFLVLLWGGGRPVPRASAPSPGGAEPAAPALGGNGPGRRLYGRRRL